MILKTEKAHRKKNRLSTRRQSQTPVFGILRMKLITDFPLLNVFFPGICLPPLLFETIKVKSEI